MDRSSEFDLTKKDVIADNPLLIQRNLYDQTS